MLETVVRAYIEQHQLLPQKGAVIVAVSGGCDSICLLHLLYELCGEGKKYPGVQLHVAHLNHQLRGTASEQDAEAVVRLATAWGLPVSVGVVDVPALAHKERRSLEDAARVARYHFLRTIAQGQPIAVAHHQDDQVETLLLHWLRGGGLASIPGLQPRQHDIIRPLLAVRHVETLAYCVEHQLPIIEDASNSDPRFLRNRIRHELLPLLTSMNAGMRETLLRNAEVLSVDFAYLESQVDQQWFRVVQVEQAEWIQLALPALLELPLSLQRHLLRRVTAQLSGGQSPLELRHFQLIEELLQRASRRAELTLHLPQHIHAVRCMESLVFKRVPEEGLVRLAGQMAGEEAQLTLPGHVAVPGTPWIAQAEVVPETIQRKAQEALKAEDWALLWRILPTTPFTVYVDRDRLWHNAEDTVSQVLHVRTRRAGDRLQPLGMSQEKKVQDILVDRHVPRADREQVPLFLVATRCIWLAGIQIDERVRLSAETRKIVRLAIVKQKD